MSRILAAAERFHSHAASTRSMCAFSTSASESPAAGSEERALERVPELPHVARPGVTPEGVQGLLGEAERRRALLPRDVEEEVLGERRHVLGPFAQLGGLDAQDVEAVVEILAEL